MNRIAIIHPQFKKGYGVSTLIYEACKRLRDKYDISIFTLETDFEASSEFDIHLLKNVVGEDYEKQVLWTTLYTLLNPDIFSGYDLIWIARFLQ